MDAAGKQGSSADPPRPRSSANKRRAFGSFQYREDRDAYYVSFTVAHQRVQKRAGSVEADAERKLDHVENCVKRGLGLAAILAEVFGEGGGTRMTFVDAAPLYLQYAESRKKASTWHGDVSRLRIVCRASWARRPLPQVTPRDLTLWLTERTTRGGVTGPTANRYLGIVSALLTWAMRMGYVASNVARRVERFSEKGRERTVYLSDRECDALVAVASEELRAPLICLLHTGLRASELTTLAWSSVDFERNVLVVEAKHSKSGKSRDIRLTPALRAVLEGLKGSREGPSSVFCGPRGRQLSYWTLRDRFAKAVKDCDAIPGERKSRITLHVTRHTFASVLAQEGAPMQEIADLLGHSTTWVTERYMHLAPDAGERAIRMLEQRFGSHGESFVSDVREQFRAPSRTPVVPAAYPPVEAGSASPCCSTT